jgi:hypothetical protein
MEKCPLKAGMLVIPLLLATAQQMWPSSGVLVSATLGNQVHAYLAEGTNWQYTGVFAGGTFGGQALSAPHGLAQDTNQFIYIVEASTTGRVLRFDTNGVYLGSLGTNGVNFFGGNPQALLIGPDHSLLMSVAFGTTSSNCIWKCNLGTGEWTRWIANSGAGYSLNVPRGMAFGADGHLVVADRANNVLRKFNGSSGAFMSNVVSFSQPQALYWDAAANRFLVSRTFNGVIEAVAMDGTVTPVYTQSGTDGFLDIERIEGQVAFTRYDADGVDLVTGTGSALPVARGLNGAGHLLAAKLGPRTPVEPPGCPPMPGTVIRYSPKTSNIYLGSPAIAILPNGDYLASHDYFGSGSSQATLGQTFVYRSSNRGTNWTLVGQINQLMSGAADDDGQFWNHFIQVNDQLYAVGNESSGSGGVAVIRRATNNGALWSYVDASAGRLFANQVWRVGHTYAVQDERIWIGVDRTQTSTFGDNFIGAMFAPTNADLLIATNWSMSTTVARNTSWLGGTFVGWLEPNLLQDTNGGLVIMLRVDNRYPNGAGIGGKAALVRVTYGGGTNAITTFTGGLYDPSAPKGEGFVDFPGGITRFTVRFDPVSQRYWSLCNYIPRKFRTSAYNAERFRAVLALASSPDLRDWTVERLVMFDQRLYSSDAAVLASAFDGTQTDYGFQYVDWQFDGPDLVATVRTGFCDDLGGSNTGHDANYYLFRRVENFRQNAGPETLRITGFQAPGANGIARVTFATRPARLYRVQASDDLQIWQDVGTAYEGDGEEATIELSGQAGSRRFYRISESASWL